MAYDRRAFPRCTALLLAVGSAGSMRADEPGFVERSVGVPSGKYAAVAMADVDGDGRAEILSGRRDGEQGLVLFVAAGAEWSRRDITERGEYGGVALADLTGDGRLDIVAVLGGSDPRGVEIHENQGKAKFRALPSPYDASTCDDLAVADLEGDGDLDLAISTGGKGVRVLVNAGDGRSFRTIVLETRTYEDTGIGLGDLNGDGRPDIVVGNHPRTNPRLFLSKPKGDVAFETSFVDCLDAPGIGFGVAFADLDGDRKLDLTIGTSSGLKAFRGNGCQGPPETWCRPLPLRGSPGHAMQVAIADVDGDDRPDIACATAEGIDLFLSRGKKGEFERVEAGLPRRQAFSGCALADQDGDGDVDLACSSLEGGGVRLYENRTK